MLIQSIFVLFALLFLPIALQDYDFRGGQSFVEVDIDPSTPAMAAYIDSRNDTFDFSNRVHGIGARKFNQTAKPLLLQSSKLAIEVNRDNLHPIVGSTENPYLLAPKLTAVEIYSDAILPVKSPGVTAARENGANIFTSIRQRAQMIQAIEVSRPEDLPVILTTAEKVARGVKVLSEPSHGVLSLRERASQLIAAELDYVEQEQPDVWTELTTTAGGKITVSVVPATATNKKLSPPPNRLAKARLLGRDTESLPIKKPVEKHSADGRIKQRSIASGAGAGPSNPEKEDFQAAIISVVPEQINRGPYKISGDLMLTEGVAFGGNESTIDVYQVVEEEIWSHGKVDIEEASYSIEIESLLGTLVVELRDSEGQLQSKADINIYDLQDENESASDTNSFRKKIKLRPSGAGVIVDIVSANSSGKNAIPAKSARMFVEPLESLVTRNADSGMYLDDRLLNSSTFMYFAKQKNHWGSVAIGIAGEKNRIRMFSDLSIQGLMEIGRPIDYSGNRVDYTGAKSLDQSVIWGRVMVDGRPIAGATVELEGGDWAKPIYFYGNLFPDSKATVTSSDGLFAFINISPGIQVLRALHRGRVIASAVVPSEPQYVSYVKLNASEPRTVDIEVFDAFNYDKPLSAEIKVWGQETKFSLDSGSDSKLRFKTGYGLVSLDATGPSEYEVSQVVTHRFARNIKIPMVKKSWITKIAIQNRLNIEPETSIVFGLLGAGSDQVSLINIGKPIHKEVIIYFDKMGNRYKNEGSKKGEAVGFVIFNVTTGLRTINLSSEGSGKIWTQLFYADPGAVSSFQFEDF